MFSNIGLPEVLFIALIIVILFGATRLPQIGEGIGKAIRNFKKSMSESDKTNVAPKNHVSEYKNKTKDSRKS